MGFRSGHTTAEFFAAEEHNAKNAQPGLRAVSSACNAPTRQEPATLRGHDGDVWSVAFSPDGKTLASGSADHTVKLWVGDARK